MKMKAIIISIFVISSITSNASFKIDSMLGGTEVSMGPYYTSVSVGNLTKKYSKLEPADEQATGNVVGLLELLRRMFSVGIFTMPPLDPFTSNVLKPLIIGPDNFISGKVLIKSVTVTGAKRFNLKLLELRMKTGRVDFEVYFPDINFNADFQTDLYVGGIIPLSLKGQLRGLIDELQLTGALQTEVRLRKGFGPNVVYQVSGATVSIRASDVKVALVNGMHLDKDLLQSIYDGEDNSSLSTWIASTKDIINKYAVNAFLTLVNKVLRSLSVVQVNAYLLPEDTV